MSFVHLGTDLAIDLGTANTCVYAKGRGVILNEPSLIAFNAVNGAVEAVGAVAREMLGRSPAHLRPVRPIKDGVIADFDAAEKMLTPSSADPQKVRAGFVPRARRRANRNHASRAPGREGFGYRAKASGSISSTNRWPPRGAGCRSPTPAGNMILHRRRHLLHRRHLAGGRGDRPLGARRRRRHDDAIFST